MPPTNRQPPAQDDWETQSVSATEEKTTFMGMPGASFFFPLFCFLIVAWLTASPLWGCLAFAAIFVPFYFFLRGKPSYFLAYFIWHLVSPRFLRRWED